MKQENQRPMMEFSQNKSRHLSLWQSIVSEARNASRLQPDMASFFHNSVLNHSSFRNSIGFYLASKLANTTLSSMTIQTLFQQAMDCEPQIVEQMVDDLLAYYTRDPACNQTIMPLLYFKGFHAVQSYRITHWLWRQGRKCLAIYLQHRIDELYDVDIHPAAKLGSGIMLDHATGLVIGETAVIGDNVSMLHGVTLGGSGATGGDRHPKVRQGVLISAGAKLLGNIVVNEGAKIGAGSLVLADVAAYTTVVGIPARAVKTSRKAMPAIDMDQIIDCDKMDSLDAE